LKGRLTLRVIYSEKTARSYTSNIAGVVRGMRDTRKDVNDNGKPVRLVADTRRVVVAGGVIRGRKATCPTREHARKDRGVTEKRELNANA